MNTSVLCVDDEPNVLMALERALRKQFQIKVALGPEAGLAEVQRTPYAVVVSDFRMPGMDGIQFLSRVKKGSPETVRLMLTGQADVQTAMAAVNEGSVFRFLAKPCPSDVLAGAITAALEQFRLVHAERELLEKTLTGSIEVLSEILSLVNPAAFSRAHAARLYIRQVAAFLNLPDAWQYELAAMLSQIGCVIVPPAVLEKKHAGLELSKDETEILSRHPMIARGLIAKIPRLELIAQMVANQQSTFDEKGIRPEVVLGSKMLRVALDLHDRVSRGAPLAGALAAMRVQSGYDARLLAALEAANLGAGEWSVMMLQVSEIRAGMLIGSDVRTLSGVLLVTKGQMVTEAMVERLKSFVRTVGIVEPITAILTGR